MENRNLVSELERYISTAAINQIRHQKAVESIQATILFSDMRGFTSASFSNDISDLFDAINFTMRFQSDIIQDFGGYVDSFSGDGLLAVFDHPDGAVNACNAAIQILDYAGKNKGKLWESLPIGIGIHHGEVMRGDIGSNSRSTYTVIGSTVNLSARLCGVAKGCQTVVSQSIVDKTGEYFGFGQPQSVILKGLPGPVSIYPLLLPRS